jgi:hypothetical protein
MQRLVQAGFPMNAVTKLFLTHLPRRSYAGRVEMGNDLMVIDIGAEVRVNLGHR